MEEAWRPIASVWRAIRVNPGPLVSLAELGFLRDISAMWRWASVPRSAPADALIGYIEACLEAG
eukprot:1712318-Alexandrium_andersonii.AAC.1